MALDLRNYDQAINDIMDVARKRGEAVEFAVLNALGVAIRHTERVREGKLQLTDAVRVELDASLERGRAVLQQARERLMDDIRSQARYDERDRREDHDD
jgi:hypothetical protein